MSARSNERFSRCTFAFADGRRCRMLRFANHLQFCHHHALKEAQALAAERLGQDMTCHFAGRHFSACDLAAALNRLLDAVASGLIKPGTASTLAYLARTLLQTIHLAEQESPRSSNNASRKLTRDSINRPAATCHQAASPAQAPPLAAVPPAPRTTDRPKSEPSCNSLGMNTCRTDGKQAVSSPFVLNQF